jgi:hypothetical protein
MRGAVVRPRHHPLAVAAERRAPPHAAVMAFQDGDLPALRIPDASGAVLRRRHNPLAVAAERRATHVAVMAFQHRAQGRGAPGADTAIDRAAHERLLRPGLGPPGPAIGPPHIIRP